MPSHETLTYPTPDAPKSPLTSEGQDLLQDPHSTRPTQLEGLLADLDALNRGERSDNAPPLIAIEDTPDGNPLRHLLQLQEELGEINPTDELETLELAMQLENAGASEEEADTLTHHRNSLPILDYLTPQMERPEALEWLLDEFRHDPTLSVSRNLKTKAPDWKLAS
jgi:hypothetical protein